MAVMCLGDKALLVSDLFFRLAGHHPNLHSFPTRRSSDLARRMREIGELRFVTARGRHVLDEIVAADGKEVGDEVLEDRKSTRLNSSHTVISYAVFCLKKKNRLRGRRHRDTPLPSPGDAPH